MEIRSIKIEIINSLTILQRIIETVTRHRISIKEFSSKECDSENGIVVMSVVTDDDKFSLIKKQLQRQIDVMKVS